MKRVGAAKGQLQPLHLAIDIIYRMTKDDSTLLSVGTFLLLL